jgi:hypothetical protein
MLEVGTTSFPRGSKHQPSSYNLQTSTIKHLEESLIVNLEIPLHSPIFTASSFYLPVIERKGEGE